MIIRKLRLEKGWSQEQLAEMAGVSTRTLQRIERGANASPETLKCLAAALDIQFSQLREEQSMQATDPNHSATSETAHDKMDSSEKANTVLPRLEPQEREAMEYVRDIKGFYIHALQYAVVMVGLVIINLLSSPDNLWVIWPALGWGLGVAAHGLSVFEVFDPFGQNWEKKQIERYMKR